jgi:hypothetical protein
MCHEYTARAWHREYEEDDEDETPAFLNEEGADTEVLTDGGEE